MGPGRQETDSHDHPPEARERRCTSRQTQPARRTQPVLTLWVSVKPAGQNAHRLSSQGSILARNAYVDTCRAT